MRCGPHSLGRASCPQQLVCVRPHISKPPREPGALKQAAALSTTAREYEATRRPAFGERLLRFIGRVPAAVSRPGAALFGIRSDGDSDAGALDVEAQLLPVAARRSLELTQGEGGLAKAQQARDEAAAADDLDAAVETIENAKARVGRI
jgi:hypothetical protein